MRTRILMTMSVTLVLAMALPAIVQAAFPKTSDTLIVPAKSIGGFALFGSPQKLAKAWGPADIKNCETLCTYSGPNSGEEAAVSFQTTGANGTVFKAWSIYMHTGEKLVGSKDVPLCPTGLSRFQTAEGIHICSKVGELKKAYGKKLKKLTSTTYELPGPGERLTYFTIDAAGLNEVTGISVMAHRGG